MDRFPKVAVAMGLSLSLVGCVSPFDTPSDLTLIELHAPAPVGGRKPTWMNIVLGSKENYQDYVLRKHYTAGAFAYFCDAEKAETYLYLPAIIKEPSGDDFKELYDMDVSEIRDATVNAYYLFSVYIYAFRPRHWYAGFGDKPNQIDEIDLLNAPRDVCIYFRGGSMTGGYRSNVVRIPKERLAEEMAHPTPGGRPFPSKTNN